MESVLTTGLLHNKNNYLSTEKPVDQIDYNLILYKYLTTVLTKKTRLKYITCSNLILLC